MVKIYFVPHTHLKFGLCEIKILIHQSIGLKPIVSKVFQNVQNNHTQYRQTSLSIERISFWNAFCKSYAKKEER